MILAALALLAAAPALSCGAVARPGIAELGQDGAWRGRAVELCRAVAVRVNGPGAPIDFHSYRTSADLRNAASDDIAFVSRDEAGFASLPSPAGPVIATARQLLVVLQASPLRSPADLAGRMVCFIAGTAAEDALDGWAGRESVPIERLAFQEPIEMRDAFDVGKCAALALDAQEFAGTRGERIVGELASTPVLAQATMGRGAERHEQIAAALTAAMPAGAAH